MKEYIVSMPAVGQVVRELIRCKDCKHGMAYYHGEHRKLGTITYCCKRLLCDVKADDYCSMAEREEE